MNADDITFGVADLRIRAHAWRQVEARLYDFPARGRHSPENVVERRICVQEQQRTRAADFISGGDATADVGLLLRKDCHLNRAKLLLHQLDSQERFVQRDRAIQIGGGDFEPDGLMGPEV